MSDTDESAESSEAVGSGRGESSDSRVDSDGGRVDSGDARGESDEADRSGRQAAAGDVPAVELDDVTKEYTGGGGTVTALESVDVSVTPGEFVAVMGPSGSGKSTMLNMIGLLDGPTAGTVRVDGDDVTGYETRALTDIRRQFIGFVFQNYYLLPTLTAVENVELPMTFTGSLPRGRAEWLLHRVGLGDRLDHRPTELSGGQKQRVAIARALINEPAVVLADEPTGNLDTETGDQILSLFREIVESEDVALIAVTHDPNVAKRADRRIDLTDGRIR